MIALRIEFVAGQFHANPWNGRSKNGETEWPPAPWRLLREIVTGWQRNGGDDCATIQRVLDALATCPTFELPMATSGHTRHGIPALAAEEIEPNGALKLDSFIALAPDRAHRAEAFEIWPTMMLSSDEWRLLETSCAAIRDLGSRESACAITAVSELPSAAGRFRVDLAARDSSEGPTVRRLAALPSQRGTDLLRSLAKITDDTYRTTPMGSGWIEYRMPLDFGWVAEQALQRDTRRPDGTPASKRLAA